MSDYPVKFNLNKQLNTIPLLSAFFKWLDEHIIRHCKDSSIRTIISQRSNKDSIKAEDQPAQLSGTSLVYNLFSLQWAAYCLNTNTKS